MLIRPRTHHDYATDPSVGRWELRWAHVHPPEAWFDLCAGEEALPGVLRTRLGAPWFARTAAAFAEAYHCAIGRAAPGVGSDGAARLAMNAIERAQLYATLARPPAGRNAVVQAVRERIHRDLDREHSLGAMAAGVGLSPSRLAQRSRAATGQSVRRYAEDLRLARARDLLELGDRSISAVAALVGFRDPLYFSRRFRRRFDCAPRQW